MKHLMSLLLLLCLDAHSQQLLTLETFYNRVEESNQALKQQQWRSYAATEARKMARASALPQIDAVLEGTANLNHLDDWHAPKGEYRPYTYQALATLNMPIYQGGNIRAQIQMSRANESSQMLATETLTNNLRYECEVCYWEASAARALLQAAQTYRSIIAKQQQLVEKRFEEGAIGRTDLLLIATRGKEAELQLMRAKEYLTLCLTRLNGLMNVPPDSPVDSLLPIDTQPTTLLPFTLEEVLARRADYRNSFVTLEHTRAARKMALSQYLPKVNLFMASGWDTGTTYMGDEVVHTPVVGMNINIPLVRWGESFQAKRRQQALIAIEELAQSELHSDIEQALFEATTRLNESAQQVSTARQTALLADENLRLITFAYNEGRNGMSDVLTAQLSWTTARSNLIQALLAQKLAIAEYRRATNQ